jgi:hypothetical protein
MTDSNSLYGNTPTSTGNVSSANLTTLYSGQAITVNSNGNLVVPGTLTVNGCAILSDCSTFTLLPTSTTINFGAAATAMSIGASSSIINFVNDIQVSGNTIYRSGGSKWMEYSQTTNSLGQTARVTSFNATAPTGVIVSNVDIDSRVVYNTGVLTTSTTAADQILFAIDANANRSATFTIQVTSGSAYQTLEVAVLHDGTNTYINTYSDLRTGANLTSVNALFVSGSPNIVNLVVTPVNAVTSYIAATKVIIV